jgi:hypothetical protein
MIKTSLFIFCLTVFSGLSQDLTFKLNCSDLMKSIDNSNQFEIFLIKNQFVLTDVSNEVSYYYFADGTEESYSPSFEMPSNNPLNSLNPDRNYVKGLKMENCFQINNSKKHWAWRYTEETKRAYVWFVIDEFKNTNCVDNQKNKNASIEITINVSTNENYNSLEQEFLKCCKYVGITDRDGEIAHEYSYFNPVTKITHTIFFVKRLEKSGGDVYISIVN